MLRQILLAVQLVEVQPHIRSFSLSILLHSRKTNKGIGAELVHYLGDGLFQTNEI